MSIQEVMTVHREYSLGKLLPSFSPHEKHLQGCAYVSHTVNNRISVNKLRDMRDIKNHDVVTHKKEISQHIKLTYI